MNVIISNERQNELANLDIEVIKSIHGVFEADELVQMFSNFFFGRMILDLTALKDYRDVRNLQKFSMSLDVEKIIVLLPDTPECLAPGFLSKIISMGIYNFTTNLDGVNYLLNNPNTYRDVAHLHQIEEVAPVINNVVSSAPVGGGVSPTIINTGTYILGIKNLTDHSGSTMLTYMLKNEIKKMGKSVVGLELDKKDFIYLNDKEMFSIESNNFATSVLKHKDVNVILVDLNNSEDIDVCNEVIYLLQPSTIKLNKLMRKDRRIFEKLAGKKIVISQNVMSDNDIRQFEREANIKIFFSIPPLDERTNNSEILQQLLSKLGIGNY